MVRIMCSFSDSHYPDTTLVGKTYLPRMFSNGTYNSMQPLRNHVILFLSWYQRMAPNAKLMSLYNNALFTVPLIIGTTFPYKCHFSCITVAYEFNIVLILAPPVSGQCGISKAIQL